MISPGFSVGKARSIVFHPEGEKYKCLSVG